MQLRVLNQQFAAQIFAVIYFPVEDEIVASGRRLHWLMSGWREIQNRKPSHTECDSRPGSTHAPPSSGPRWRRVLAILRAMLVNVSAEFAGDFSRKPEMPHMLTP